MSIFTVQSVEFISVVLNKHKKQTHRVVRHAS